jgi:hypothetical protein
MEARILSMYGFRLNTRDSWSVVKRLNDDLQFFEDPVLDTTTVCGFLSMIVAELPVFDGCMMALTTTHLISSVYTEIPQAHPYNIVIGIAVPDGTSLNDIHTTHSNPVFEHGRELRRFFRERLQLRLDVNGPALWTGHPLPPLPFIFPRMMT